MKLFISYRRHDSIHAAHRVRMCLERQFGKDSVFIDRDIPPGRKWEEHIDSMLVDAIGMVVLVGDEFLQRLKRQTSTVSDGSDPMVWEIAAALRMGLPIYPVLIGTLDMPLPTQLPAEIQAFSNFQAVFAREPSFDVAMNVLIRAIQTEQGLDVSVQPDDSATTLQSPPPHSIYFLLFALASLIATSLTGRLIIYIGEYEIATDDLLIASIWIGTKYLLLTTLIGLAPYLAFWFVAVLRARARIPIRNIAGIIGILNMTGILIGSGTFLLLSLVPGWRLHPLYVFPDEPQLWHYFALAVSLLVIVLIGSSIVLIEPKVRRIQGMLRDPLLVALNWLGGFAFLSIVWLIASLYHSFPKLTNSERFDEIAWLGYFCLTPVLCVIYTFGWKFGRKQLLGAAETWEWKYLFYVALILYIVCTLALYSLGVGQVLNCPNISSTNSTSGMQVCLP